MLRAAGVGALVRRRGVGAAKGESSVCGGAVILAVLPPLAAANGSYAQCRDAQ